MDPNAHRTGAVHFTRGVLSGTLGNPAANGLVRFGLALKQLNPPYLPPGTQNTGDSWGIGQVTVTITLYNSETNTIETVTETFIDTGGADNRSEATLTFTPVLVPVPIELGQNETHTFCVELNAATDGVYSGDFSLENNDGDENPFEFPIVGIVDGTPPMLVGMPGDMTLGADPAPAKRLASPGRPRSRPTIRRASRPPGPAPTVTQTTGPTSPATIPVGTTTITYEAEDCAGNKATASFDITVTDTTPPVFTSLPPPIVVTLPPGASSAPITYPPPTATDDCDPNPVVTCNPPPECSVSAARR